MKLSVSYFYAEHANADREHHFVDLEVEDVTTEAIGAALLSGQHGGVGHVYIIEVVPL